MEWTFIEFYCNRTSKERINISTQIIYKDIDFELKNKLYSVSTQSDIASEFMDISLFKMISVPPIRQATLEHNLWRLDGSYDLPQVEDKLNMSFFSQNISSSDLVDNEYVFDVPVDLSFKFSQNCIISNIAFNFDEPDFCTRVVIQGFDDEDLSDMVFESTFYPDNSFYTCALNSSYSVSGVKFIFYSMNKPNRFLKIFNIDFGTAHIFADNEIYNVSILKETSLISDSLPIGTSSISLKVKNKDIKEFKKYKPIYIYKNNKIERVHYISNREETTDLRVDLECADTFFLLNDFGALSYYFPTQNFSTSLNVLSSGFGLYPANGMEGYIPAYNLQSTLKEALEPLQNNLLFRLKVNDDILAYPSITYTTIDNKKELLHNIVFAEQLLAIVQNDGSVLIKEKPTHYKEVNIDRVYSNLSKRTEEKVNQITFSLYEYTEQEKQIELEADYYYVGSVSESLPIRINYLRLATSDIDSISANNIKNNSFNYRLKGANENINYRGYISYNVLTIISIPKTINLEMLDANTTINPVNISDIKHITTANEEKLVNNLSSHYKHNTSVDFDMVIENEDVGDLIRVHTKNRIYTGAIENLEYTMQGKKIGAVTLRIYEEEDISG